ncbi:Methyl sulfide methyltransferase-associated sensor [uncultured archaeon]|nr:Methyl sulfide methyltransferase-associated sensor [uncultured archaeon]
MKLQYKFFIFFATLILIFGSATIVSTSMILKKELEHTLIVRERIGSEVLEHRIFPYIANKDYDKVTSILFEDKAVRKESIYYIFVNDNNGNILAHTFLDEIPRQIKNRVHGDVEDFSATEISINDMPVIEIVIAIKEGAYEAGHLHVGYKKEYIDNIISQIINTMVFILVILMACSIILTFFLSKFIVKPIKELSRGMLEVSKGNLNHQIKTDSKDELGELALTFKKMTEDLRKTTVSKDYVDNIIRSMFGTIVVVTPDGQIQTVNQATCDMLGYKEQELVGQTVDILFADENIKHKAAWFDELTETNYVSNIEKTYLAKDGRKIPMIFTGSVMRNDNGEVQGLVCVALDITERKRMMEQLKQKNEFVRTTLESLPYPFYVINAVDHTIALANSAAFGGDLGKVSTCYALTHKRSEPCKSQEHQCPLEEVKRTGRPAIVEHVHLDKNGDPRNVEVHCYPIFDSSGNVVQVIEYSLDITERKEAEKIRLENLRLDLASRTKSEFLANMSHELRTPLNAIIGFCELIKQKVHGGLTEKQEHYVDNVLTSGKFLLSLINDILDLSKVEAGKIELVMENISLPSVINETMNLIKEKASKHNIALKTDFDPMLDIIEADQQRLKQILFNLLSNAVKFSKEEGGTVTITTKKEGDMAKISVSDTGIGIREDDLRKLFTEFEQLDSGISKKYGGTGLGLSITKKLVELHGGKIMVESKYGERTTFTFLLPLVKQEKEWNC